LEDLIAAIIDDDQRGRETKLRHDRGEVLLASANHMVYPRPGRLHQDGMRS
jgi:hypothetical protein